MSAANVRKAKNEEMVRGLQRSWRSSAKADKTIQIIKEALTENVRNKICVFSQVRVMGFSGEVDKLVLTLALLYFKFTRMLDVLEIPLRAAGLRFVRYDGTMTMAQREAVLSTFRDGSSTRILLISLKCGSLGLNLVCANHLILCDPWWNPAIEDQAVDRVHRIGQTKPVKISRLIVEGTIEERIMELQEKKRELIKGVIGEGGTGVADRLSWEQLRFLFRG